MNEKIFYKPLNYIFILALIMQGLIICLAIDYKFRHTSLYFILTTARQTSDFNQKRLF